MKQHQSDSVSKHISQDPSEKSNDSNAPMNPMEKRQTPNEGEIRKVQQQTYDREAYGDEFEVQQENEMTEREADTEKANRPDRKPNKNSGDKY